jgi:hypothetical protein
VATDAEDTRAPLIIRTGSRPGYPGPLRRQVRGSALARILRTTDAKQIGLLYLTSAFGFFLVGGFMALLMRAELARPGMQFLSPEQYNQLFTMHGTIMLLLFATPIVFAFANFVVPLQIGAPDVSFPRLNAFAYWLYLFGGLMVLGSFLTPSGAADFGWTAYTPLSDSAHSQGVGGNMWIVGLVISGLGTILGGVNMITTIITMRAPGMTMFRMPIFTWNILVTSVLVIAIFPMLAATLLALAADRVLGAHVFDPSTGGPMLWQHLFWFFGHPEVYVVALPFFGIITEVIPVFSRKPVFGYKGLVGATLAIAVLSFSVWAHHMFATGQVLLPFFSFLSYLIAVPTGLKFFTWIGTMWRGQVTLNAPMLERGRRSSQLVSSPFRSPNSRLCDRTCAVFGCFTRSSGDRSRSSSSTSHRKNCCKPLWRDCRPLVARSRRSGKDPPSGAVRHGVGGAGQECDPRGARIGHRPRPAGVTLSAPRLDRPRSVGLGPGRLGLFDLVEWIIDRRIPASTTCLTAVPHICRIAGFTFRHAGRRRFQQSS